MAIMTVVLSDNSSSECLSDQVLGKLNKVAGVGIKALCENNPSLLVFPDGLGDNGDDLDEPLCSISGGKLWAGNLVGFWGINDVNVHIRSRFDSDGRQFFFHYMLQRIAGINILNMPTSPSPDDIWDFLIYLFPMMLKRAMRQGMFRAYRTFKYDNPKIKGPIEVARFIRNDVPFVGNISYSVREHTENNHVTQLIRHTIEYIRRRMPCLLSVDAEVRKAVSVIVQVTPDYNRQDYSRIIAANLRPIRHPYYTDYGPLQKLCLRILRHERLAFGSDDGSVCGIVFDAAWLWEEYLNTVFVSDSRFDSIVHPRNKLRKDPIYLFKECSCPRFPDFYDLKRKVVFDAKYKRDTGIGREDLYQIISYVYVLECGIGVFIKPSAATGYVQEGIINNQLGAKIGTLTLRVPMLTTAAGFAEFAAAMRSEEQVLLQEIERVSGGVNDGHVQDKELG